jgi:hypothetical protein
VQLCELLRFGFGAELLADAFTRGRAEVGCPCCSALTNGHFVTSWSHIGHKAFAFNARSEVEEVSLLLSFTLQAFVFAGTPAKQFHLKHAAR